MPVGPLQILVLCLSACTGRVMQGNWLAPGAFFSLFWTLYLTAALVSAPYFSFSDTGLWIIVLLCIEFQIGAIIGSRPWVRGTPAAPPAGSEFQKQQAALLLKYAMRLMLVSGVVGCAGAIYFALIAIRDMGMPGSAEGLISVGGIIYSRRVTGEYAPWVVRLCVAWLFPAGLVGGIAAGCLQTARQRLITLVPFIPGLLVSAVTSSRANLVALFCCWIGAFIAVRLAATAGNYRLTTPKRLLQVAAVAAIFAVFFLTFGWLRSYFYGKEMKTDIDVPFAQAYFVGSVASFGDWVQGEIDFDRRGSLGLGAYTLVPGLLDLLGVKEREVGVTAEFTHIGYGQVSNVYTAFRGLVEDFSLPGSAVFLFFTGLLCGSAYRANMTGGIRGWPILVLAAFYGCTIYSPLVSLFVYNSIHLAWFVAALLMVRCHQVAGSTRNRPEYSEKFREAAARLEQRRDAGGGPRGTRIAVTERN